MTKERIVCTKHIDLSEILTFDVPILLVVRRVLREYRSILAKNNKIGKK